MIKNDISVKHKCFRYIILLMKEDLLTVSNIKSTLSVEIFLMAQNVTTFLNRIVVIIEKKNYCKILSY